MSISRQIPFCLPLALFLLCLFCLQTPTSSLSFDFLRPAKQNKLNYILDRLGIRRFLSEIDEARNGKELITNLDDEFRWIFVLARRISMLQANNQMEDLFRKNRDQGKMQRIIPPTEPFPCDLRNARSPVPPNSVHELRPGDIDVIASVGDSLSAGNGLISQSVFHTLNEFRGFSFGGGGYGDWRTYLTLPNILKVFNPNLNGYSTANELTVDSSSRLNIAEPMIMSRDLPFQARIIIDRMRQDANIDMEHHWKLLNIFIGNNDICSDMCHYDNITVFLQNHEDDLRRTFTILRDNVPRLLVNLIPVPNVVIALHPMRNIPLSCVAVHHVGCHCVFSERIKEPELQHANDIINRWHGVDQYVARLPEFQTNDFAVVYHPYMAHAKMPTLPNGDSDLRYFASDCFHFSQLGHASMANSLWNSMFQPEGHKQLEMVPAFREFLCPSEERPYIATLYNSCDQSNGCGYV